MVNQANNLNEKKPVMQRLGPASGVETPPRTLRDYAILPVPKFRSAIMRKPIASDDFELDPIILEMVISSQYGGTPSEDPNAHIVDFLEICDAFTYHGVSNEDVRLMLFSFSLRDDAKDWLRSLPPASITTWEELSSQFLRKFYPPASAAKIRSQIFKFYQLDEEALYEAWERFKKLIRRCPNHGIPKIDLVLSFYFGLNEETRTFIDIASGGVFMDKTVDDAYNFLEELAMYDYQWPKKETMHKKGDELHKIEQVSALNAKLDELSKKLEYCNHRVNMVRMAPIAREYCPSAYQNKQCQEANPFPQPQLEQGNCIGNLNWSQNNPYSNACNSRLQNDLHSGCGTNLEYARSPSFNQQPSQERNPALEETLQQLVTNTAKFHETFEQFMVEARTIFHGQSVLFRNLEASTGQIASMLTEMRQGDLPSSSEINLKEHFKDNSLRRGKKFEDPKLDLEGKEKIEEEHELPTEEDQKANKVVQTRGNDTLKKAPGVPVPQRLQNNEAEVKGYPIYVLNLPQNCIVSQLEAEFTKFGQIKKGGVQVRSYKGTCYACVEFLSATSMDAAIQASPIMIGGQQAVVGIKRSVSRVDGGRGG